MALFDVTQTALERALAGSSMRQGVLANNLANANTAGFKRSDVNFESALAGAMQSSPTTPAAVEDVAFAPEADTTSSTRADGNNVDVDVEMANLSSNSITYSALAAVAKARLHQLEIVIGGR